MKSKVTDYESLSDDQLIVLICNGDASRYFEILYKRYRPKVYQKCYSFVKNKQKSEELTEDVFSKCFEKLPSFKQKSLFSSWLYSITYNHCIDYLREKKRLHYPAWDSENEIPEIIDETDEHLSDISYEQLEEIFEKIHPEEKAILLMKYQEDLSIKKIGEVLRISENATKMRLKRARTRVMYLYASTYPNLH